MVLALSICGGGTVSLSNISNLALDGTADGARAGSLVPPILAEPPAPVVQVTAPPPAPAAPRSERALSANPLWAMPLAQFAITRERPIFSPSRRPPPPAVAPIVVPKMVAVPKPKEAERPQLSLVGTVSSEAEGFGIFLDQSTQAVVRLKVGEDFQGWKLRSVRGRETALEKDQKVVTLALPQPGLGLPPPSEIRNEVGPPPGSDIGRPPSRPGR
jgi:general secretion pathway protein N